MQASLYKVGVPVWALQHPRLPPAPPEPYRGVALPLQPFHPPPHPHPHHHHHHHHQDLRSGYSKLLAPSVSPPASLQVMPPPLIKEEPEDLRTSEKG